MENKYNQSQSMTTQGDKNRWYLILGLVIALVIGYFAVSQIIKFQNRASVIEGDTSPFCGYELGECSVIPNGNDFKIVVVDSTDPNNPIEMIKGIKNQTPVNFTIESGKIYRCTVVSVVNDVEDPSCKLATEQLAPSCLGPTSTPPETTPTETPAPPTPTPTATKACEICGNPGFKCDIEEDSTGKDAIIGSASCPIRALWGIDYITPPASAPASCTDSSTYTPLNCKNHTVIIRPEGTTGAEDETLLEEECNQITAGTYVHRADKGLRGDGCREYKIIVLDKTSTPKNADITEKVQLCRECIFKASCPSPSCEESEENRKLSYSELVDIPDLNPETGAGECADQEKDSSGNTSPCYLSVGNRCALHGAKSTFRICALGQDARIWVDDPYNGGRWIDVPFNGEDCAEVEYTYNNSGLYDVVLECANPPTGAGQPIQYFHCQERIKRTCVEVTTSPPTTPPVTPACIQIQPKLDFTCKDCITPPAPTCNPNIEGDCDPLPTQPE